MFNIDLQNGKFVSALCNSLFEFSLRICRMQKDNASIGQLIAFVIERDRINKHELSVIGTNTSNDKQE